MVSSEESLREGLVLPEEQLRKGLVFTPRYSRNEYWAARKKEMSFYSLVEKTICVLLFLGSAIIFSRSFMALSSEDEVRNYVSWITMSISVGVFLAFVTAFVFLLLSTIVTGLFVNRGNYFLKSGSGKQIVANWEEFDQWLKTNFGIEMLTFKIISPKSKFVKYMTGDLYSKDLRFNDRKGNTYVIHSLDDNKDYVVYQEKVVNSRSTFSYDRVVLTGEERIKIKRAVDSGVFYKLVETLATTHELLPDGNVVFKDFPEEVAVVLADILKTLVSLKRCDLDDAEVASMQNIQEEVDELSELALRLIPAGFDDETSHNLLEGFTRLSNSLIRVLDEHKGKLNDELVNRAKLIKLRFDVDEDEEEGKLISRS